MKEILINLAFTLITTAIPFVTYYLLILLDRFGKYIRKKLEKLTNDSNQELIDNTLQNVLRLISQVVSSTSQTYVESLKASGSFDEEAQKTAFNMTKDNIMKLLDEESKRIIEELYSDIDTWIKVQIEDAVRMSKY